MSNMPQKIRCHPFIFCFFPYLCNSGARCTEEETTVIMIQLKQLELMKRRGYSATLQAAYQLLADNIKTLFKYIWPFSLVYALVSALWIFLMPNDAEPTATTLLFMMGLLVVNLIVELLFLSAAYRPLNQKSLKWNYWRITKFVLCAIGLGIIIVLCYVIFSVLTQMPAETAPQAVNQMPANDMDAMMAVDGGGVAQMGLAIIIILALALLLLPYYYVATKYIIEPTTRLGDVLTKGYVKGLKHWGYIFITLLLAGICLIALSLILTLPMNIANIAYYVSAIGVSMGDAPGLPGYFFPLVYIVMVVTCFISSFLTLYTVFLLYYMYGSIEMREKEKKSLTQSNDTL